VTVTSPLEKPEPKYRSKPTDAKLTSVTSAVAALQDAKSV
jgi:hypothetical protein